ncbi:MAG: hypothetical protein AB7P08_06110 [Burkholderiales bacterium]
MNLRFQLAMLVVMTGCDLCNSSPTKLQQGFDQIIPSQTTAAEVVVLMGGQPTYKGSSHFLNVLDVAQMTYIDHKYEYTVTVAGSPLTGASPRVLAKGMRPRKAERN